MCKLKLIFLIKLLKLKRTLKKHITKNKKKKSNQIEIQYCNVKTISSEILTIYSLKFLF